MSLLSIERLCAGYGRLQVLRDVSLHVDQGEVVTLIGANGAGKSTMMRVISRLIPAVSGIIRYRNELINEWPAHRVAREGIAHVPEGRGVFGNLTVNENLLLSFFASRNRIEVSRLLDSVFGSFPVLGQRRGQLASTLSGGEQQMLAIGRAIIADGDLFILDEPSMGLSPIFVKQVFALIDDIRKKGKTILLVEQNAAMALRYSSRAYVMENGRIIAEGPSLSIAQNPELKKAYLG